jgi:integrase
MKEMVIAKYPPTVGLIPGYQTDVKQFLSYLGGAGITAASIADYFDSMREAGKAPATIARHRSAVKKYVREAVGAGITLAQLAEMDAFFKAIKPGTPDHSVTDEKILSKDEMRQALAIAGPKTAAVLQFLFQTAARVSETVAVRLVDCEVRRDHVAVHILHGKGDKQRTVFISVDLFEKIRSLYSGETWLFEGRGGKHLSRHAIYMMIKRIGARIGRGDVHPHSVRHSWASAAVAVLGLAKTSGYLGHADTSTTARYYLHGKASAAEITGFNNILQFA